MENIERKGEIARYEQFLLFPQCFPFYRIDNLVSTMDINEPYKDRDCALSDV